MNALYNWLLIDWHWLIIWIVLGMAGGSVKSAFRVWSKHRIAVVQAAHPAVPVAAVKPRLDECQHYAPNVTAVLDQATGERLAWYCQACDQQLAASWALSQGEAPGSAEIACWPPPAIGPRG